MTMTYCRACGNDVHITHSDDECPAGNADLRVPDDLRAENQAPRVRGERR